MDNNTIFTKTAKGVGEAVGKTRVLSRDLRSVLKEVDGKASLEELVDKISSLSETKIRDALNKLCTGDYIREFVAPTLESDTLDFTTIIPLPKTKERPPGQRTLINEALRKQLEARAQAEVAVYERMEREQDERERRGMEEEARRKEEEAARRAAQQRAMKAAQESAEREAEERARQALAEEAQRQAEQEARREAEEAARRQAQAQAEVQERIRQQAEQQARQAEEEKLRLEAEAKANREAEERAKQELAEQARRAAEEHARREAEEQSRREAEAKARKEAEEQARQEAEVESRKEAEERARKEAEIEARRFAEEQARAELEQIRLKAEEQSREEARQQALREAEERARREAEEQARQEAEEQARREAEAQSKKEEEDRRRQAAELQARQAEEERSRREAEQRAQEELDEKVRLEIEERARQASEEKQRLEAEAGARREAEENALRELAEQARRDEEALADEAAEDEITREFEALARQQAEEVARHKAEQARRQIEEVARRKAEAKAKKEEEKRARKEIDKAEAAREAEEKAKQEIERWMREAAEEKARTGGAEVQAFAQEERSEPDYDEPERQYQAGPERPETPHYQEQEWQEEQEAAERSEQDEDEKPSAAKREKPYRKPIKWGRPLALTLLLSFLLGLGLIHVVPFDSQAALFEKTATAQFGQPVKVGKAYLSLFPLPHWRLEDVSIGSEGQITARRINIAMELASLLGDRVTLKSIELDSPAFSEQSLEWLLFGRSPQHAFTVERISASNAKLASKSISLPPFDAAADIRADGSWEKIAIDSVDRTIHIQLRPNADAVQIELDANTFELPFGSTLTFGDFRAKGIARRNELAITDFTGNIFDGIVAGTARLQWGAGWALKGDVHAKLIDASLLAPELLQGGKLEGNATFVLQAEQAGKLFASPYVEGLFAIQNGTLLGVDFAKLIRSSNSAGRSTFSELTGSFVRDGGNTRLQKIFLNAGLLSVKGSADMDVNNTLSGQLAVELKSSTQQARRNLAVTGTLAEPEFNR